MSSKLKKPSKTISNNVKLELSQDETMVLYEFLEELDEKALIKRKSDKRIVLDLICMIEEQSLFLINNPDYKEQLEKARKALAATGTIS